MLLGPKSRGHTSNHIEASFDTHKRHFRTTHTMVPSAPTTIIVNRLYHSLADISESQNAVPSQASNVDPLVMQIVVRRDLFDVRP